MTRRPAAAPGRAKISGWGPGAWVDEKRYFKPGLVPDNSNTGTWGDVAHYVQMIWPTSQRIGCALASNARDDFLVCRYSPAGNIVGRDPLKG